jgi:hypothetical protein
LLRPAGRAPPPPLDLAAVPYIYIAALVAVAPLPVGGSVPMPWVAVGIAACAAGGLIALRQTGPLEAKARRGMCVAVAVATVLTLMYCTATWPITADGDPNLGFNRSLLLLAFVSGFYWDSLSSGWRWLAPGALAVNTAIAVALFPVPPVDIRSVVSAIGGTMYPFFACRHLTSTLGRASAEHARSTRAEDEEAVRTAFSEGRESVVSLVRQARQDALAQLERLGPQLDAGLGELAAIRLEEVDRRLRTLDR